MYSVRSDTAPRHETSCIIPAGSQTARRGGATKLVCEVTTDITPAEAYRNCARSWQCTGSVKPGGYSSSSPITGLAFSG
mgnify:CR=1 FL=1